MGLINEAFREGYSEAEIPTINDNKNPVNNVGKSIIIGTLNDIPK